MVLLVQRILFRFVVMRPHKRMIEIKDEIRPRKELAWSKEARMKDEEDREGRGRREEFDSFTTSKGEYGSRVESGGDSEREK